MSDHIWFTVISFHIVALLLFGSMLLLSRRPALLYQLLAAVLGLVAALIDVNSDDVQVTVLLLLVFGYFLGFARRTETWQLGILLGMWVPLFAMIRAYTLGGTGHFIPEGVGSLLSLVPAFVGVFLGAAIRRMADRREETSS
jgi:hypothetical protein